MALLLPVTFTLTPVGGMVMLASIFYGAMYGGSTTSVLLNIPGEAASVVTCIDGYQMARQGRAGAALGISAFGSFIAGTLGAVGIWLLSMPLVELAVRFGPAEYFALLLLGFSVLLALARGAVVKSSLMILLGVLLALVGQDAVSGEARFTFGRLELMDGVGLVAIAMGLFGLGEVLT